GAASQDVLRRYRLPPEVVAGIARDVRDCRFLELGDIAVVVRVRDTQVSLEVRERDHSASNSSGWAASMIAFTSSTVIRPPAPVPLTVDRAMPCASASRRAASVASTSGASISASDGPWSILSSVGVTILFLSCSRSRFASRYLIR